MYFAQWAMNVRFSLRRNISTGKGETGSKKKQSQ
jgi:hypothetical protein